MSAVSDRARAYVGCTVEVTSNNPKRAGRGVVVAVRRAEGFTLILQGGTGKTFPAIQFRIKPSDGRRSFWTDSFPDESEQVR